MHRSQLSKPNTPRCSVAAAIALTSLRAYKVFLSPLFTGSCRFYPSCADYMSEAIQIHGATKGIWLGIRRLGRCHPLGSHGVDPVPPPVLHS
jgi:putative membrane protein insertion efficiency factor